MGRFLNKIKSKIKDEITDFAAGQMPTPTTRDFEANKPDALKADIRMISGCEDHQTSADVSNVNSFALPDPAGRAGGACTSTLLNILYKDEAVTATDMSFTEVLNQMRVDLGKKNFTQVPQLTASNPIDVNHKFDLVPDSATGTRRAVMVGINYIGDSPGELAGCHNDVGNMKKYIMDVHGFKEEDIVVLLDDGVSQEPTRDNIMTAYRNIVAASQADDAIFLHYSGHGTKIRDDDHGEEEDGFDEALCPRDYASAGLIRDDDLFDLLVKGLPEGVHLVSLMDCCHSGTILDLPYIFKADGQSSEIHLNEEIDLVKLLGKVFDGPVGSLIQSMLQ